MWPLLLATIVALQLPAPPPALSPELEQEARQIETLVIAPCCWSQQVSVHSSPASTEMKTDIRRRLAAGQTRDQILAAYTGEYGDRILAEPPNKGFNTLLYVLPPLLGTAGIVLLVVVVRRFTSRAQPALAAAGAGSSRASSAYDERVDDELRSLD